MPSQLEIIKKHLKVHGVLNRYRDLADRTSDIEKIKTNLTHLADTNYWAPLYENNNEEELTEERPNIPQESTEAVQQPTSNK